MFQLLKRVFEEFSADKCPRMAAVLAYYTIFSLAPLLVLAIALAGMVWDPEDVRGGVAAQIERTIGPGGAEQVQGMLKSVQQPGRGTWATTLSLLGLVIGATAALGQLQAALNEAWSVEPNPRQGWGGWVQNFFVQRLVSLVLVLLIAALLLVSAATSTALAAVSAHVGAVLPGGMSKASALVIHSLADLVLFTLLFAAIFKILPDAKVAWRDVWTGAAVTAVLFIVGKFALGFYLGQQSTQSAYGAVGSIGIVLIFIYYAAMILLFGRRVHPGLVVPLRQAHQAETRGSPYGTQVRSCPSRAVLKCTGWRCLQPAALTLLVLRQLLPQPLGLGQRAAREIHVLAAGHADVERADRAAAEQRAIFLSVARARKKGRPRMAGAVLEVTSTARRVMADRRIRGAAFSHGQKA